MEERLGIKSGSTADRMSVALITKAILELSSQVAQLTAKLATSQAENAWMKNRDINQPRLCTDIMRPETQPRRIPTQAKIETYILEEDRGLTLTGTAPTTTTRWRIHTRLQHVAFPEMSTTSQLRYYTLMEERLGIKSGSTADQPSEKGRV